MELSKELLNNLYVNDGKTMQVIAEELGVSYGTVRKKLLEFAITIRNSHYSQRIRKRFPVELENKDWLYEKYIIENQSLVQIAVLLNVAFSNIRAALIRHGVPLRSKSAGQRNRYSQNGFEDYFVFNKSVIEGALLGDGGLKKENKYSDECYPVFCKGNIGYDHILWVANLLFSDNGADRIIEANNKGGFGIIDSKIFRLATLSHQELLPLFKDWYPNENNFEKIIPESLVVDKDVLLHWFLDDGYSYWVTQKKKYRYLRVQFATQCFTKIHLDLLADKIKSVFGLNIYPRFHQRNGKIEGYGYFMELSHAQNGDFFDIIGIQCLQWRINGNYRRTKS